VTVQPDLFAAAAPRIYSVHEINDIVRVLLEDAFRDLVVEGEISNAKQHSSGHWYFTLKDESAQLAAVMFRADAQALRFRPENGLAVRAAGRLSVYAAQGKFQIIVRTLLPVGQGALELAFRQLQAKLQAEGLFEAARKRPLPLFPRRIALITSPSGAAVRDMLITLRMRWPVARVLVVPVAVQGEAAPADLVRALEFVNRHAAADVVIVARGGGSLEDLWAFNDERVARAIAASRIPVVSGVGHEVDTTIADFVADRRAATPTAAAALVVPHQDEIRALLLQSDRRAARALRRRCELPRQRLGALLGSYGMRRLRHWVPELVQVLDEHAERIEGAGRRRLETARARHAASWVHLQALGPQRVLERGYTYCRDADAGLVVGRAALTRPGQALVVHFADGTRPMRVLPRSGGET
jgi:exodeoxyribonuclease VII large subunit